eukprot:125030-Prorocentrum_minimum.AAC.1
MEAVVAEAEAEFLEMLKGQSADGTFNTLVSEPARPTPTPSFSLEQSLGEMDLDGLLARLTAPGGLVLSETFNGEDPVYESESESASASDDDD